MLNTRHWGEDRYSPHFDYGVMMGEAWAALDGTEQQVVRLVVAGYSQAEVGERLGVSQQRVSQYWTRATEKMREFMESP